MKKIVFLPVFAIVAMVSQIYAAWAPCTGDYAGYCKWGTDCHPINKGPNDNDECEKVYQTCFDFGYIYNDAQCTLWSEKGNDPDFTIVYCKWPSASSPSGYSCEKVMSQKERDNCKANSTVYSDNKCEVYLEGRDPSATALGCCKWDNAEENPDGKCWTIWSTDEGATTKVANCKTGKNIFWTGTCPATSVGACPTSAPVYPSSSSGTNPNPGLSSSSSEAMVSCIIANRCYQRTQTQFSPSDCRSANGTLIDGDCPSSSSTTEGSSSSTTGGSSSSTTGGSSSSTTTDGSSSSITVAYCIKNGVCIPGPFAEDVCLVNIGGLPSDECDPTPIITLPKPVHSNSLSAMQSAVNLQLTSNAAIQIFDLKGKAVRSLKFVPGNYVVPLSDLPRGLYIVKASNASWKQTIKVTVR